MRRDGRPGPSTFYLYHTPRDDGESARYASMQTYAGEDEIPIVIDGRERGRVAAAGLFPAGEPS